MIIANRTTQRITKMHEYPCNKHDTLSVIKQEASRSTGTISFIDQSLQNIRIIMSRCSTTYTKFNPCNIYAV